jgi:PiT family inorganic phosphate transporter
MWNEALFGAALLYSIVSGANDGSTLVAIGVQGKHLSPIVAAAILAFMVAGGSFIVGHAVAVTLADKLVSFEHSGGAEALFIAVIVSLLVVLVLSWASLPTSLTLALIGAIVGVGVGAGLNVSWLQVASVLALGVLAPVVALLAGIVVSRVFQVTALTLKRGAWLGWAQRLAFILQSLAYSGNDAQKMYGVLLVVTGGIGGVLSNQIVEHLLVGLAFLAGAIFSMQRVGARVSNRLTRPRVETVALCELTASLVVVGSSSLGAPISSTQSVTAALVGTGTARSVKRIRWLEAGRIAVAWVVTLPASVVLGILAMLIAGRL